MALSCGVLTLQCEKVYLFALEKFLGVEMRIPNDFVNVETNRYKIFVNSAVTVTCYWLKLTRIDVYRLPGKAYRMLPELDT